MKRLAVLIMFTACHKQPPPIAEGRCLADRYERAVAVKQLCHYSGFRWECTCDGDDCSCDRKGEQVGEFPK